MSSVSVLLSECARPSHRVFRMGGDMLFDCDLRAAESDGATPDSKTQPAITRVI